MILTARDISRASYILRARSIYSARAHTHYSKPMNNYPQDFYSEVKEYDEVYNNRAAYNDKKYKKNARRAQRKNRQAAKAARYDSF